MKEKIFTLLYSSRFQGALGIAVLQALVLFNLITDVQLEGIVHIVQGLIAVAITIRTVDRLGDKKVESAQIASGTTAE